MMSDQSIPIDDMTVDRFAAWRRGAMGECKHRNLALHGDGEFVTCKDCGHQVGTYWALIEIVHRYNQMLKRIQVERGELAREREKVIHRIAARKVESAWRTKMVPTCPHCKMGIRPDDGFGDTAICHELDEERRARASQASIE